MTGTFCYNFTPEQNGGESLLFSCKYEEIGMPIEEITLCSYGSSATITTCGVLTSENLFKLAKELQRFELKQELKNESRTKID